MSAVPLHYYLVLAAALFTSGIVVVIVKKNAVFVLIGIELMLNAANLNLIAFSMYDSTIQGQLFAVFSVMLAAAEAVIALAILVNIYRTYDSTNLDEIEELKN